MIRGFACFLGLLLGLVGFAPATRAQDSAPDSTANRSNSLLQAIAEADTTTAPPDTTSTTPEELSCFGDWTRRGRFSFDADVSSVTGTADFLASSSSGSEGSITAQYDRSEISFRQQDRDATRTNFDGSLVGDPNRAGELSLTMNRNTLFDVTRFENTSDVVLENENQNAMLKLLGNQDLTGPFSMTWHGQGALQTQEANNRGTNQGFKFLTGGGGAGWRYGGDQSRVRGRFGYLRKDGEDQLRGRMGEATSEQDTVGVSVVLDRGATFNFTAKVDRSSLFERRLDYRRNAVGTVDTLQTPGSFDNVGQERERRRRDRVEVTLSNQALPILGFRASVLHSLEESNLTFSGEGTVLDARGLYTAGATLDYAERGNVDLSLRHRNDWFDRKPNGEEDFRGKKFTKDYEISLVINQEFLTSTRLRLTLSQKLNQQIYRDPEVLLDADRFSEVADAQLDATPFSSVDVTLHGTLQRSQDVNIRAVNVANNKEDRLYDLRGGYTWQALRKLYIEQVYRMEILFKDYDASNDRDQFNKHGDVASTIRWASPSPDGRGWDRNQPVFELRHNTDFRETGRRNVAGDPFLEAYARTLRKFDHEVSVAVTIPWKGWAARVEGARGVILESNPSTGVERPDDPYGRLSMSLTGDHSFWNDTAVLNVELARILQYGTRVRPEQEDYWDASSSFTVNF